MRAKIYLFVALMLLANCLFAQKSSIDKYLLLKPSEIKAVKTGVQEYDVSLKWQNLDAINGNTINCNVKFESLCNLLIDLQREIIFNKFE